MTLGRSIPRRQGPGRTTRGATRTMRYGSPPAVANCLRVPRQRRVSAFQVNGTVAWHSPRTDSGMSVRSEGHHVE